MNGERCPKVVGLVLLLVLVAPACEDDGGVVDAGATPTVDTGVVADAAIRDAPLADVAAGSDLPPDTASTPVPPAPDASDSAPGDTATTYPGPTEEFTADPGRPPQPFGPLCSGWLRRGEGQPMSVSCTMYSTSRPSSSHLYVRFDALPSQVASAYVSLVYGAAPWRTGVLETASAGRLEIVFRDGARFANAGGSDLKLTVNEAAPSPASGDPTHYLRAGLEAKLDSSAGGAGETVQLDLRCE